MGRQKLYTCTNMMKTLRHAHRRTHWPHSVSVHTLTPIIVTNQIKKCIQFLFTLPHVTHAVNTRTNQTDTWLCQDSVLSPKIQSVSFLLIKLAVKSVPVKSTVSIPVTHIGLKGTQSSQSAVSVIWNRDPRHNLIQGFYFKIPMNLFCPGWQWTVRVC